MMVAVVGRRGAETLVKVGGWSVDGLVENARGGGENLYSATTTDE